jgi:hypothetical protein
VLLLLLPLMTGLGRFILYPGTKHGFAVRGSRADLMSCYLTVLLLLLLLLLQV